MPFQSVLQLQKVKWILNTFTEMNNKPSDKMLLVNEPCHVISNNEAFWQGVNSGEPVQPPFKLRDCKCCSVSSLTVIEYSATSKGSDQTARMRRLVWAFAGRIYHIVGNLMSRLKY